MNNINTINLLRNLSLAVFALIGASDFTVFAQAPVEERNPRPDAVMQGQQKAGIAYRELQQAESAYKQAELNMQRAEGEYRAAVKRADELKRQTDDAKKSLDAAKVKEAQARRAYDAAVNSVDESSAKKAGQK